jgi:hypothetical protein
MLPGDMIEVNDCKNGKGYVKREFIAMASTGKFLCWSTDKEFAVAWEYAREIDPFKELKECETLGARFECRRKNGIWSEIIYNTPNWHKHLEYRIKGDIAIEQFKTHHKEITAWWDGTEVEYYSNYKNKWIVKGNPFWSVDTKYRIKKTKTIYEWIYKDVNIWQISGLLLTEVEAKEHFKGCEYKKTDRSWSMPN